eukprot:156093_1
MDLKRYEQINTETKHLMDGYIRTAQKSLFQNIPQSINVICSLFYYQLILDLLERLQIDDESDQCLRKKHKAFCMINEALKENPKWIESDLNKLLPLIYEQTNATKTYNYSPRFLFEEKTRIACFQCLDCLLDTIPNSIPSLVVFMNYLSNGIIDTSDDIQMVTYGTIYKMTVIYGSKITDNENAQMLNSLPNVLMKGIKGKMKEAKQKDGENAKNILRAACKALYALRNLDGIGSHGRCRRFANFYSRVEKTKILIPMINELKQSNAI